MKAIPVDVQVKLEDGKEFSELIFSICIDQLTSPSNKNIQKISSHLGNMANSLRSALNFTMRDFAITSIKPLITHKQFKEIENSLDFPYITTAKAAFDRKSIVREVQNYFPNVYQFLESLQPYYNHGKNVWLAQMMKISNKDKHVAINELLVPNVGAAANTNGSSLTIDGKFVTITHYNGTSEVHVAPCYLNEWHMFVTPNDKGYIYIIKIDPSSDGGPDLVDFIRDTPDKVEQIINNFYATI